MSISKKILFWILAGLLVIASIELGAALLQSAAAGRWTGLAEVAERRRAVLGEISPDELRQPSTDRFRCRQALHPYLGFTADPEVAAAAGEAIDPESEASRFGLPHNVAKRLFYEPSDHRLVVGVFGGSVASIAAIGGGGVGLERELRKIDRFFGREIVVISFADGGVKQPQQLMTLAWFLTLGAHFDLVLNIDGFNEIALPAADLVPRRVFPFYPRDWDQRVGPLDGELRGAAAALDARRQRRRGLARRFSRWPWRASHVAAVIWRALDARAAREVSGAEVALLEVRPELVSYATHGPSREYGSRAEMFEDLARFWTSASQQMHHLCRSQGIEYHHFLQPNQYLVGSKPIAAERESGAWREDHRYRPAVQEGYPRLIAAGRELGDAAVAFHDLTAIFTGDRRLLYSDACCHLTFFGNLLLQRAIVHRLSQGDFRRPENLSDGGLALEGYDPVSYFDGRPLRGRPDFAATFDGVRYLFASSENRERFEQRPEGYVPEYGGWCAFGMGTDGLGMELPQERYPVDPEAFEIVDGKLYLFYHSPTFDALQHWRRDRESIRGRAAEAWARLGAR